MAQSTQCLRFHVGESKDGNPPQPVRFNLPPDAYGRIQLWAIALKEKHVQLSLIALNFLGHLVGLVSRMATPNQENGPRVANHDPIDPSDHVPIQLAWWASSFPRLQSIPSIGAIHRQPFVDASAAKPYGADYYLRALAALHLRYRSPPKFRQHFRLQFPAIHCFLFHDRYHISSVKKCPY
jgi:hypothetical protein